MAEISRRAWLKGLALFSVTPAMLASTTAEANVTKAAVHADLPHVQVLHLLGRQERRDVYGYDANRSLPTSPG
jgi:hypothetical protein